jgi:hypothetical protein
LTIFAIGHVLSRINFLLDLTQTSTARIISIGRGFIGRAKGPARRIVLEIGPKGRIKRLFHFRLDFVFGLCFSGKILFRWFGHTGFEELFRGSNLRKR